MCRFHDVVLRLPSTQDDGCGEKGRPKQRQEPICRAIERHPISSASIHIILGIRVGDVDSPQENSWPLEHEGEYPDDGLGNEIPADKDIEEGDEEKTKEADFPPAMPPGV